MTISSKGAYRPKIEAGPLGGESLEVKPGTVLRTHLRLFIRGQAGKA